MKIVRIFPHLLLIIYLILDWNYWMTIYLYSCSVTAQIQEYIDLKSICWVLSLFGYEYALLATVGLLWVLLADKLRAITMVCLIGILYYVMALSKMIYIQPRPYFIFPQVKALQCDLDYGNPSGHSLGTLVIYTLFIENLLFDQWFCDGIKTESENIRGDLYVNLQTSSRVKSFDSLYPECPLHFYCFRLFMFSFAYVIGLSRVYLGVHSYNQILLGFVIGVYFLYTCNSYLINFIHKSLVSFVTKYDLDKQRWNYTLTYSYLMLTGVALSLWYLRHVNESLNHDKVEWLNLIQQKCPVSQVSQLWFEDKSLRDSSIITYPIAICFLLIQTSGAYSVPRQNNIKLVLKKAVILAFLIIIPTFVYKSVEYIFELKRFPLLIYLLEGHILPWVNAFQLVVSSPYIYLLLAMDSPGDLMRKRHSATRSTELVVME